MGFHQKVYVYYVGQFSVVIAKQVESISGEKVAGFICLDDINIQLPSGYELLHQNSILNDSDLVVIPSDNHYEEIVQKIEQCLGRLKVSHYIDALISIRQQTSIHEDVVQQLSNKSKNIAILLPSHKVYQKHYQDLPDALEQLGCNVVIYTLDLTTVPKSLIDRFYCVEVAHINLAYGDWWLFDVVVSDNCLTANFTRKITSTLFVYLPHGYVGLCERMLDGNFTIDKVRDLLNKHIVEVFDFLLLPTRQTFEFFYEVFKGQVLTNYCFAVKGGYKSLDLAIGNQHEIQECTAILYSPGALPAGNTHHEIPLSFPHHSEKIIENLLKHFPDREVIFRPHPASLSDSALKQKIDGLNARFANEPNYTYDEMLSHQFSFNKSACVISDTSTSAYTFAFSQLKPVVFYIPNEKNGEKCKSQHSELSALGFRPLRQQIGTIVSNTDELVDALNTVFSNTAISRQNLMDFRQKEFFNLGNVTSMISQFITNLIETKGSTDLTDHNALKKVTCIELISLGINQS